MVRVKYTERKMDKNVTRLPRALMAFRCSLCDKSYVHRQSLYKHLRNKHRSQQLDDVESTVEADLLDTLADLPQASTPASASSVLLDLTMELAIDVFLEPASTALPASTSVRAAEADGGEEEEVEVEEPGTSRHHAAGKDIRAQMLWHNRAMQWPPRPVVGTADLYSMMIDLPDAGARDIADLAAFRYKLDKPAIAALRRRLSSMLYARQTTLQELRNLLPIGDLDGNSAIAAIQRIAAWLAAVMDERPPFRPCE